MSNQIEIRKRILTIAQELESEVSSEAIISKYTVEWKLSERTIRHYFALATDIIMERFKKAGESADMMRAAVLSGNLEFYRTNAELESKLISMKKISKIEEK